MPHDVLCEFFENVEGDAETVREVIEASNVQELMAVALLLLGRSASESGRLRQGAGGHSRRVRRRARALL